MAQSNNGHFAVVYTVLDSKLKFDDHVSSICRKVRAQINALNRLKNNLPIKTKESLYRSFILPNFYYCNQVWHHYGKRNTTKIEKVNERALSYVCNDTHLSASLGQDKTTLYGISKSSRHVIDNT